MDFLIEPYDRVMTAYNLSENLNCNDFKIRYAIGDGL